ncbi:MarR family winged helix-turn-helix transcriptional regulator [Paenibacillus chitinolyticus]|uniref:MarR family winged helix-turn-helix transcriptional regulator n=1 Tax=Paenibacillus chitinolyticus TaxID=79263 RepID=UPI00386F7F48
MNDNKHEQQQLTDELIASWALLMPLLEKKMMRLFERQVKQTLGPQQFYALVMVEEKKTLRLSGLAAELGVSKQQLTPIVDKLLHLGYIERVPDPQDRRASLLHATAEGKAFIGAYKREIGNLLRAKADAFSHEQLVRLNEALKDLHDVLGAMD